MIGMADHVDTARGKETKRNKKKKSQFVFLHSIRTSRHANLVVVASEPHQNTKQFHRAQPPTKDRHVDIKLLDTPARTWRGRVGHAGSVWELDNILPSHPPLGEQTDISQLQVKDAVFFPRKWHFWLQISFF